MPPLLNAPQRACAALAVLAALILPRAHAADEWRYTVNPGDTLIGLSDKLLKPPATWQKLQRLNRVADPLRLTPGSTLRIPAAWLRGDAAVAEAAHVQGDVQLQRDGAASSPLVVGTTLRAGDSIRTGEQATLTLRFVDGSRALVAPDSRLVIESLLVFGQTRMTETRLRVDQGGLDSRVAPQSGAASKFEVKTPTLNLGVRGTDFQVRFDASSSTSRSEVFEGRVAAQGQQREVLLAAGFGTLAAAGAAPATPRRLLGAPALEGIAERLERVPLRFAWKALPEAKAYRAQVFADRTFDRLLLDGQFSQPMARWVDLPDGKYVLRVRAVDEAGLEGAATLVDFVLKARPEPPFTSAPSDGTKIYGDQASFRWTASSAAERYRLQVAATPDFKAPLLDRSDLTATEFALALAPGNYHWRIATIARGNDQGPFSDTLGFVQRKIPESPALEAPTVGDKELTFRWKARDPGQTFQVQVASDAEFKSVLLDKPLAEPQVVIPKPEPGVYYLRVRAIDGDGFAGPFGGAQQFEIKRAWWWYAMPLLILLAAL